MRKEEMEFYVSPNVKIVEIKTSQTQTAFGWLPEYRPFSNKFDETVMNAVPVAVSCFMASESFEDAVRKSIVVGGDSDTIGAITGSLAEAYYGIPDALKRKALSFLPEDMLKIYREFGSPDFKHETQSGRRI